MDADGFFFVVGGGRMAVVLFFLMRHPVHRLVKCWSYSIVALARDCLS